MTVKNRQRFSLKPFGRVFAKNFVFEVFVFQKTFTDFSRSLNNLYGFSRKQLGVRYICVAEKPLKNCIYVNNTQHGGMAGIRKHC
jgi:hypothetical protein